MLPEPLLALAETMAGTDPVKAKAAKLEMAKLVHTACAPKRPGRERAAFLKQLSVLLDNRRPRLVRAHAAQLIGYAGGKADDKALAKYASDPEIGEDILMARERIQRAYSK